MVFVLEEALDSDIPRSREIERAAYNKGDGITKDPFMLALFPGPFPADANEQKINRFITERKNDPTIHYLKVVDTDTESRDMVAFAKFCVYDTKESAAAAERPMPPVPGSNVKAVEVAFGTLKRKKKEIMGDRMHLFCHGIQTDPKYQRRGAAGMLMKWCTDKADELDLPVYLESSPWAHEFYLHRGFEDVEVIVQDLKPYSGVDFILRTPCMVREPKKL